MNKEKINKEAALKIASAIEVARFEAKEQCRNMMQHEGFFPQDMAEEIKDVTYALAGLAGKLRVYANS